MRLPASLVITLLTWVFLSNGAAAVTLAENPTKLRSVSSCTLTIDGTIVSGDADRIEALISASTAKIHNYPSHIMSQQYVVCLSGPGGNYPEGIKMARIFSRFDVTTVVNDHASCLSACAIAFMGGRYNSRSGEGYSPSRYLYPDSKIGFHAPQLTIDDGNYSQEAVLSAYKIALDAISEIQKSSKELFLDEFLITEMFAHRDEDFYFISTVDDLAYFDIGLLGYRERPIKDDNRKAACWNAFNWQVVDSNERLSASVWRSIFQDGSSNITMRNGKRLYEFYPFDGPMYCHISAPPTAPANGSIKVVLSESADLSDPRASFYTTPLILMRGNRLLPSTR